MCKSHFPQDKLSYSKSTDMFYCATRVKHVYTAAGFCKQLKLREMTIVTLSSGNVAKFIEVDIILQHYIAAFNGYGWWCFNYRKRRFAAFEKKILQK